MKEIKLAEKSAIAHSASPSVTEIDLLAVRPYPGEEQNQSQQHRRNRRHKDPESPLRAGEKAGVDDAADSQRNLNCEEGAFN